MSDIQYTATGRRKTATARVDMRPGSGAVEVNGRRLDGYFPSDVLVMVVRQPLVLTETAERFDISATVEGGGYAGQAGAIRHGISRALLEFNGELRERLRATSLDEPATACTILPARMVPRLVSTPTARPFSMRILLTPVCVCTSTPRLMASLA